MQGTSTISSNVGFTSTLKELWSASIAPSTRRSYNTGFDKYLQFLLLAGIIISVHIPTLPVSEEYLIQFVAYCYSSDIAYSTIKLYICGVRHICLERNIPYPNTHEMPRLHSVLNGVKRLRTRPAKTRLPITFDILERMCKYLLQGNYDLVFEAVITIAFFGFLRCGEFTVSGPFDPTIHLCVQDMVLVQDCVLLTLKCSKTDPFRQGVVIKLFRTNHSICPYNAAAKYMARRMSAKPSASDPLFVNNVGQVLSRPMFIAMLKHILECINIDSSAYNGHSFRIGAATSAASVHLEDHMIKTLGRWSSDAYCRYIRTPVETIKAAQQAMVSLV